MRNCAVQDMEKHVASLENARATLEAGLPIQFIYIYTVEMVQYNLDMHVGNP